MLVTYATITKNCIMSNTPYKLFMCTMADCVNKVAAYIMPSHSYFTEEEEFLVLLSRLSVGKSKDPQDQLLLSFAHIWILLLVTLLRTK